MANVSKRDMGHSCCLEHVNLLPIVSLSHNFLRSDRIRFSLSLFDMFKRLISARVPAQ